MMLQRPEWLLLALPLLLWWLLAFRQLGRTRWVRLAMMASLVSALADPRVPGAPPALRTVLVLDRSASVQGRGVEEGRRLARQLRDGMPAGDELYVVGFGRGASLLAAPGEPLDALDGLTAQQDSDLTAGLRLAAAHGGDGAEVLLVSDGVYTGDDPREETADLSTHGVAVHTLILRPEVGDDVAILQLHGPGRATPGQAFTLGVEVDSPVARDARLSIVDASGRQVHATTLHLSAGVRRYGVPVRAGAAGLELLEARIDVAGDGRSENNTARAAVVVEGAPRVLVFNPEGKTTALHRALESSGLVVEPGDTARPLTSARLQGVAAVVLENLPLDRLGDGADAALDYYVREMGGGLIVTGGRRSYAMGGYFRSRLEGLLPVVMDRQDELRRPRIDMAIVLDRSGSMSIPVPGGAMKMDLANRGAAEAIELLAPGDKLGVLAVDSAAHVVCNLETIGDAAARRAIRKKVLAVEPGGGGIFVHTGLAAAMDMLLEGDAPTRHVILFADAADAEEPGNYRALIGRWVEAGGSLSVIGLGSREDPDAALLDEMARLGLGEVYFTGDALELPRIFAQDVMYVSRKTFLEQQTPVVPARGLFTLGVPAGAPPPVDGYNLTFLARGAETVLASGDDNDAPLAAAWQRGNGKVVAVTFEADGPFTGALAGWSDYKRFFRAALEWVKASPEPPEVSADMVMEGRRATVRVELDPQREPVASAQAVVLDPDQRTAREVHLSWSGSDTLTASFEVASDGVYQGVVSVPGLGPVTLPPVMLPNSPELGPRRGGATGAAVMRALAEATGGAPFLHVEDLKHRARPAVRGGKPLWRWLLVLLLGLLLLDIAHRRGLLDPTLARAGGTARRFVRRRRRPSKPEAPSAAAAPTPKPAGEDGAKATAEGAEPSAPSSALSRAKKRARLR